jgi:hypothetical protein
VLYLICDVSKLGPDDGTEVIIRTPAGAGAPFVARSHDRVAKLTREAIDYFATRGLLADGEYDLALVRESGETLELLSSARLEDYEIGEGDTLHLLPKAPQVDR